MPVSEPGFVPLGISGCADSGPNDYDIVKCWVGTPNEGEYLHVYAGSPESDPEQGVIGVYTTTVNTGEREYISVIGPKQHYYTPTRSGHVGIANVTWPYMTLLATHPTNDASNPSITFLFNLQTRTWEEPRHCQLFPIAFSADLLEGVTNTAETHDVQYGTERQHFGWLTWDGSAITDTLVSSLTPPGDSSSYTNPDDPLDHIVSIGDWVLGRPEVEGNNSPTLERAMLDLAVGDDEYSTTTSYLGVTVPLWDRAVRQGESIRYHISGFMWISVDHYSLAQPNVVSFHFAGHATCPNAP
jgi:hypothetical protein